MNILGVIPARFNSTRFPGKPLADILGKPMLAWVYEAASKAKKLSELIVATDDERIAKVCKEYEMPFVMTSSSHPTAANRLYEVSQHIKADFYVQINGDEPLIKAEFIDAVIPDEVVQDEEFGTSLVCEIQSPAQLIDPTNIKVVFDNERNTLYMSRTAIPFAYKSLDFRYFKHIGIIGYNAKMLALYNDTKPGFTELVEGIDTLRFNDFAKTLKAIEVKSYESLSVDTPKDLDEVIKILNHQQERLGGGI